MTMQSLYCSSNTVAVNPQSDRTIVLKVDIVFMPSMVCFCPLSEKPMNNKIHSCDAQICPTDGMLEIFTKKMSMPLSYSCNKCYTC